MSLIPANGFILSSQIRNELLQTTGFFRMSQLYGITPDIPSNGLLLHNSTFKGKARQAVVAFATAAPVKFSNFSAGSGTWGINSGFIDASASWNWPTNDPQNTTFSVWMVKDYYNGSGDTVAATLHYLIDNVATPYFNGVGQGQSADNSWSTTSYPKLSLTLASGLNVFEFFCTNNGGPGGFIFSLVRDSDSVVLMRSDASVATIPKALVFQNMSRCYSVRVVTGYGARLPVVKIRRSTDNELRDFYTDRTQSFMTTGPERTGMTLTTWLNGATGYVHTWYDQSGNAQHATNTNNNTTQPTIVSQTNNGKTRFVIQFQRANSNVLRMSSVQPNTVFCQFYNNNTDYGTIIASDTDFQLRFGGGAANNVNGDSNGSDWYFSSGGTKVSYVNGSSVTTFSLSTWNTLSVSTSAPTFGTNPFVKIGNDGFTAARSINGYMTEMILHNTTCTGTEMSDYYTNRVF
jgi:hypothetical protein